MIAGIVAAVLVGVIIWAVADAQKEAEELAGRQDALEGFTSELRAVLQTVSPPADEMAAVPPTSQEADLKTVATDAREWQQTFTAAQTDAAAIIPPDGAEVAHRLVSQSLSIYSQAAETYALVPTADKSLQDSLLRSAAAQRDHASALFGTAIEVLDDERIEADMGVAQLEAPGIREIPTQPAPQTEVEIPSGGGGDTGKGKRSGRTGGAGGNKDTDGNAGG